MNLNVSRYIKTKEFEDALIDEPSSGLSAWARTTAGVVAMLLALQFITGVLLAFYYVPSIEHAHTTVAYIEKVAPAGSWIRALHHWGSALTPLFLLLHLVQMFLRETYKRKTVAWFSCVLLLALTMAASGMGYTLPWDLNAFSSANIAEGMTAGLPIVGGTARNFLLGGSEISALTLSRFFALHVFVIAGLILLVAAARFFIFQGSEHIKEKSIAVWKNKQLTRNTVVAGLIFLALSLFALKNPAPFAPTANVPSGEFLPRPGPQFLFLFQLLKYVPGGLASLVGGVLPPLFFGGLILLPFLDKSRLNKLISNPSRKLGFVLFASCILLVAVMTGLAIISDRTDAKTRDQLAKQKANEAAWRAKPFEPSRIGAPSEKPKEQITTNTSNEPVRPQAYIKHCASCHGAQGQGKSVYPPLIDVSTKPRRGVEDMIGLIDNPEAYDLKEPMKSFKDKMTEEEKRAVAIWVVSLKKQ